MAKSNRQIVRRSDVPIYVESGDYNQGGNEIAQLTRLVFVVLIVAIMGAVFVHLYWGPRGVQVYGYIIGGLALVVLVWAMFMANMKAFASFTRGIVHSITQSLIDVQMSDDKGETARILSTLQAAQHDGMMTARRAFTTAQEDTNKAQPRAVPSIQDLLAAQFDSGGSDQFERGLDDDDDDAL